jgi:hypothetical protein
VLEAIHAAASRAEQPGESRRQAEWRTRLAVAQVWEEWRRNPDVTAEIDRFEKAAEQRLGEDGVRATMRSASDGIPRSVPGMGPEQRQALNHLGRAVSSARQGRADHEVQRVLEAYEQRDREHQRIRQRRGPSLGR